MQHAWHCRPGGRIGLAAVGLMLGLGAADLTAQPVAGSYYDFELFGTRIAEGAAAQVRMRLAPSTFEMPVTVDGHVIFELRVSARQLRDPGSDVYLVWAAPPSLDRVEMIGQLGEDLTATGRVHFNKFLVFITRSASAAVAEPLRDPIVLRGASRSGRMRSIFDHTDIVGNE